MRRAATKKAEGTSEWSRRRLLGILAAAVAVAVLLLGGLAYAVYLAIAGIGDEASANTGVATGETERSTVARGAAHRDEIAAEPMLTVPESAAFPAETTSARAPEIKIPTGTGVNGPAFVMTGFPHTPEGAIGQLAQIDLAVLQSMSLSTAEEVYNAWALPPSASRPSTGPGSSRTRARRRTRGSAPRAGDGAGTRRRTSLRPPCRRRSRLRSPRLPRNG